MISEEEHKKVVGGDIVVADLTAGDFVITGMEIEEQQYVLRVCGVDFSNLMFVHRRALIADAKKKDTTTIQATDIQKRRTALLKRLQKFQEAQLIFMPGLHAYLASQSIPRGGDLSSRPEEFSLYLPSSVQTVSRQNVCASGVAEIEDKLRYAQAVEALVELRAQLRTRILANRLSNKDASSQRAYVRSRVLQDQVEARIRGCQAQYNVARASVLALRGPGDWEKQLAILTPEDVRGVSERAMTTEERVEHERTKRMAGWTGDEGNVDKLAIAPVVTFDPRLALGEGRRTLSWIWYSVSETELEDGSPEVTASECYCLSHIYSFT